MIVICKQNEYISRKSREAMQTFNPNTNRDAELVLQWEYSIEVFGEMSW